LPGGGVIDKQYGNRAVNVRMVTGKIMGTIFVPKIVTGRRIKRFRALSGFLLYI